jgi:hypothetical protein
MGDIRTKTSAWIASGIIGFIAFVFVVSDVFTPKATRGLHEGALAGKVNGDPITRQEFARELNRRMEFFKQLAGGKVTEEQLKMFRVNDAVFNELVSRKLMLQAADDQGLTASDEEVRRRIMEMPAFQKNGRFDKFTYEQVLAANQLTPGGFERMMREDLSVQQWNRYFRDRVRVSEEEVRQQFLVDGEKRDIKYVLLTNDSGAKGVKVGDEEVAKYLSVPTQAQLVKERYEAQKGSAYKGRTFDQAKAEIARELIGASRPSEVAKINDRLADQVAQALSAQPSSDAKVNALLKPYGVTVRTTGLISQNGRGIPGVGDAPELMKDAFGGGLAKAKAYNVPAGKLVAVVAEARKADLAKLAGERDQLAGQLATRKERELFDAWMRKLHDKAKIEKNPEVVGGGESEEG